MQLLIIQENLKIAWELRFSDTKEALRLADEALVELKASDHKELYAEALSYSMLFKFWLHIDASYLENLLHALDLLDATSSPLINSRINTIIATVYDSYGDYQKALFYCQHAMDMAVQNNLDTEHADALVALGQVYLRIADYVQAALSFNKALEIRKNQGDMKAVSSAMNLLARTLTLEQKFEEAEKIYLETLKIRQQFKDENGLPWTFLGLATVALELGKPDEAEKNFRAGLVQNEKIADKRFELLAKKGLAELFYKTGNKNTSKSLFQESLELASNLRMKSIMADIHHFLSLWYESENNYRQSHHHLKEYIQIREEVINQEATNKLRNQQIAFSVAESRKEAEIYQLRNVELKSAYNAIEYKNKQIIDSINYAQRIQTAIMHSEELFQNFFPGSFILYLPKDIVSGDFYWISEKNGKIFFTDADCTGHGVPGAFVSIIGKICLDRAINEFDCKSPAEILNMLNLLLVEVFKHSANSMKDGMDIALCAYNPLKMTLEFAGARNPLYLIRKKEVIIYKGDRQSIENTEKPGLFTNHTIQMVKHDRIYLFSDGYVDQFGGPENRKFMQKRLQSLLLEIQHLSMKEQKIMIENQFTEWKGSHEQIDDVSLIGIEIL